MESWPGWLVQIPSWYSRETVAHLGTNRARCRATLLMGATPLPASVKRCCLRNADKRHIDLQLMRFRRQCIDVL